MSYRQTVNTLAEDAEQLEQLYHTALRAGESEAFQQAIAAGHSATPDNLLYAAWYYRLKASADRARRFAVAWPWVIPLALVNGLLFWWLSDDGRYAVEIVGARSGQSYRLMPAIILLAATLSAAFVLAYLTAVSRKRWGLAVLIALAEVSAGAYVLWVYPQLGTRPFQEQYITLMAMHLPLLAWAGVGAYVIAGRRDAASRFTFLIKSLEVLIMGGLFAIAGGLFTAISTGLFSALGIDFPVLVQRLFIAGGGGLIPVMAVAVIYNPRVPPSEQALDEGLSKLVALLMRILLPLTLLLLLVYLAFIPFNFREPFDNRDVLIIYNGMLFAVIALLVGATPVSLNASSARLARLLRIAIIAVAALALVISLYALAAIVYRTAIDRLTPNRLTFIGWNIINISLLIILLLYQVRATGNTWLNQLYRSYSAGMVAYAVWALAMILALPWLFGINQAAIDALPVSIQEIVYERPGPILLQCYGSPHIYLLEAGRKRWIDTIETFEARGYVWGDVTRVTCVALRDVPDGTPIPIDAGPPPEP